MIKFKKVYAVQCNSIIDGGAPGYGAFFIFENEEFAIKVCDYLNTHKDLLYKNNEYSEWVNQYIGYGYTEGLDSDFYVRPVTVIDNNNITDPNVFMRIINLIHAKHGWELNKSDLFEGVFL